MEEGLLFWVHNKHGSASGNSPHIDGTIRKRYHSYFENGYGEQMVFVYDYEVNEGTLWHGDAGWEQAFRVVAGDVPELLLADDERLWLSTCWKSAIARLGD
jgi:hypothetical protein